MPEVNEDLINQIHRYSNEQLLILAVLSNPQLRNQIDDELDRRSQLIRADGLPLHACPEAA